jgi:hypothetical protein
MSILSKLFSKRTSGGRSPQASKEDIGPPARGIIVRDESGLLSEATAPIPIITHRQLHTLFTNIPALDQQGFTSVALIGNAGSPFPPNSLKFSVALLSPTHDQRVGVLLWNKGRDLVFSLEALKNAASSLRSDCSLLDLSNVLKSNGWQTRDIDFSPTPCPPFFQNEPVVTEDTAVISAMPLEDIQQSKKCFSEASRYLGRQAWSEAIKSFDSALKMNPTDADAWAGKAGACINIGQFYEAIKCCDNAISVAPFHGGAYFNKGIACANGVKNFGQALTCFREAERLGIKEAPTAVKQLKRQMKRGVLF